jgi:hypothetical protein
LTLAPLRTTIRHTPQSPEESHVGDKGPGSKGGGKKPKQDKKKKGAAAPK